MKIFMIRPLFVALILIFLLPGQSSVISADSSNDRKLVEALTTSSSTLIFEKIQENYSFYGLASYFNNVNYYIIDKKKLRRINDGEVIELRKTQWIAMVGRFNVLLVQATNLSAHIEDSGLIIDNPELLNRLNSTLVLVSKTELSAISPELDQIRYAHLWTPLAWLTKLAESSLVTIHSNIVSNWGFTIVIFSILLKLLLLPVSIMTVRFQRKVSLVQSQLVPKLAEIKTNYDGEEAHNYLMAAHKDLGVTPFYSLKPLLGSFIQIPILIAVFNALGEMSQLDSQSFLWIENLAYPDAIAQLPFTVHMFGSTLNLLPFVMMAVTLFATITFQNSFAHEAELKKQKRNLYLMTAAFFVLFYPFPAAMVLYWTMNNILHAVQQQIIKV